MNENENNYIKRPLYDNPIIESVGKEWTFTEFGEAFNEFDVNFLIDTQARHQDRHDENDITSLNYIYTYDDDEQVDESNLTGASECSNKSSSSQAKVGRSKVAKAEKGAAYSERTGKRERTGSVCLKKPCSCANLLNGDEPKCLDVANFVPKTTQNLLICFAWILKNIDSKVLLHIWSRWSFAKLNKVLILLDLCFNHFEYRSSVWSSLFEEDSLAGGVTSQTSNGVASTATASASSKQSIYKKQGTSNMPSNSKLKNKIEDLIIGTQNAGSQLMKRSKYGYSSQNEASKPSLNETTATCSAEGLNENGNNKWLKWKSLITQAQKSSSGGGSNSGHVPQNENETVGVMSASSSTSLLPGNISYESIKLAFEGNV